jgi:hypothetical protein
MIIVPHLGPAVVAACQDGHGNAFSLGARDRALPDGENEKAPARLSSAGALDVGDTGFEPVTFSVSGRRAPSLRQSPGEHGEPTRRRACPVQRRRPVESNPVSAWRPEAVVGVRRLAGASGRTDLAGCPSKRGPYRTCARYGRARCCTLGTAARERNCHTRTSLPGNRCGRGR